MLRALLSLACATAIAVGDIALQPDQTGGDHQRRQLRVPRPVRPYDHRPVRPYDHMSVKPSKVNLAKPPVVGLEKRPMPHQKKVHFADPLVVNLEKPPMAMLEKPPLPHEHPGYLPQPASSHQLHVKPVKGAAAIHQPHVRPDAIAQHQPPPSFKKSEYFNYPHHTAPQFDFGDPLLALFNAQEQPLAAMTHPDAAQLRNYAKQIRTMGTNRQRRIKLYEPHARSLEETANTLESLHREAGNLRRKEGDLNGPPSGRKGGRVSLDLHVQAWEKENQAAKIKQEALSTLLKDKSGPFWFW